MTHKAGFVSIIGLPNAGKSTLMNALVGEKLSIITSKAQTTRHRIMGILNGEDFQVVYSDTPGIIRKSHYLLHKAMLKFVEAALEDADLILFVSDISLENEDDELIEMIRKREVPKLVLVNKIDLSDQAKLEQKMLWWKEKMPDAIILPISALHHFNMDMVLKNIIGMLPESPPYFPKDELTDRSQRFFVSEIIREKILLNYKDEIPYSAEVVVESFRESDKITVISANIHVARESQKAIILGHQGQAIRKMGTAARKDIEAFLEHKVYLELTVKVTKDWRDNELMLARFGYPRPE